MGFYIFYRSPGICRSYIDPPGRSVLVTGDYSDLEKKGDCEVKRPHPLTPFRGRNEIASSRRSSLQVQDQHSASSNCRLLAPGLNTELRSGSGPTTIDYLGAPVISLIPANIPFHTRLNIDRVISL
jgi:hypothetical protein